MKWKVNITPKEKIPAPGDTRVRKELAFPKPVIIEEENIKVWCEHYYIIERFEPKWKSLFAKAYTAAQAGEWYDKKNLEGVWHEVKKRTIEQHFVEEL